MILLHNYLVPMVGLEPTRFIRAADFKSAVTTDSTTWAYNSFLSQFHFNFVVSTQTILFELFRNFHKVYQMAERAGYDPDSVLHRTNGLANHLGPSPIHSPIF